MAVRKLKSGKWAADVTVGVKWDGSRDRRVETYPTKGQARKAETRLLMERERLRGRVTHMLDSGILDGFRRGRRTYVSVKSIEKRLASNPGAGRPKAAVA